MKPLLQRLSLLLSVSFLFANAALGASGSFSGGTYVENFDSMSAGTVTPTSWFVGIGATADGTTVVPSDGSVAPAAATAGFNFGSLSATDRALGVSAHSGDRNMEVRIRNDTGVAITSFNVAYDGEQWRVGTMTGPSTLVLRYSADGVNYVNMGSGFNFTSPRTAVPSLFENMPLDGNLPANRVAGIGGAYAPAPPVPSGGTIYLRWFDGDDAGSDPGLAVDNFSFSVASIAGPALTIRDNRNGTVTLSWPFPSAGFVLESSPELPASSWTPVADGVDVPAEGQHNVTVSTAVGSMRYFRLHSALAAP